jgi:hypothetical protein
MNFLRFENSKGGYVPFPLELTLSESYNLINAKDVYVYIHELLEERGLSVENIIYTLFECKDLFENDDLKISLY